jgi:hypothetical protein
VYPHFLIPFTSGTSFHHNIGWTRRLPSSSSINPGISGSISSSVKGERSSSNQVGGSEDEGWVEDGKWVIVDDLLNMGSSWGWRMSWVCIWSNVTEEEDEGWAEDDGWTTGDEVGYAEKERWSSEDERQLCMVG